MSWSLRPIDINFEPDLIEGVLIAGHWFEEQEQARTLLERTQAECEAMIRQAQEEANQIMSSAKEESAHRMALLLEGIEEHFLKQSEEIFFDWEQARAEEENEIFFRARKLVEKVFISMLDQVPDEDKFKALLRQIYKASDRKTHATLFFNPAHTATIETWKTGFPQLPWSLEPDPEHPSESLLLKTSQGELSLSWAGFQKHIIDRLV